MLHELEKSDFEKGRSLVWQLPLACAVEATLDGTCPGRVWVNDINVPSAAIVETPEGHYVIGNAQDASFNRSLAKFVEATVSPGGRGEGWWWFYLRCTTEGWAETMREVLPAERAVEKPREFYVCEKVGIDLRRELPTGFDLVQVDEGFFACEDVKNIENIRRRARSSFGSCELFLEKGFAFCIVHDNEVVSECFADNVSGERCEVGVHTLEGYRQRGFATLVVAAAVDWALSKGIKEVGWHCLKYNESSGATARRVGFRKVEEYAAFLVCVKPADAYLMKGNLSLIQREYEEAAGWYEKALQAAESTAGSNLLRQREQKIRYLFQAACAKAMAGQRESGIDILEAAIEGAGYRQGGY